MNVKSIFGTIGDTLNGLFGVLTGLVGVGIMSQVIFGTVSYTHLTLPTNREV